MRAFWVTLAVAPLLAGCPCRKSCANPQGTPFPPRVAFAVPEAHPIAAELVAKDAALRSSPHSAKVVGEACSDAFTTLIAGKYCRQRIQACCSGVECRAGDREAACTEQKQPELGFQCCAEAAPTFFAKVPACSGMALQNCVIAPTADGPKAIP